MNKFTYIFFTILFYWSFISHAQQSMWLDSNFGSNGKVMTDVSTNSIDHNYTDIILQPDGKIIAVGWFETGDPLNYSDVALVRYLPDGSIDSSFGLNGKSIYNVSQLGSKFDILRSGALQSDGKIVCAGSTSGISSLLTLVIRFTQDGVIDTSFGQNGTLMFDLDSIQADGSTCVEIQSDDKILISGTLVPNEGFIMRFNSNGNIDSTFGTNGSVTIGQEGKELIIQPDGKLLIAGIYYSPGASWWHFGVVRLDTIGVFDNTFGINGRSYFNFLNLYSGTFKTQFVNTIDIDQNGKVVVAGSCNCSNTTVCDSTVFAVARLNSDGVLDSLFGSDGRLFVDFGFHGDIVNDVIIQPNGKMFVIGKVNFGSDCGIAMLNSDGILENAFNGAGKLILDSIGDGSGPFSATLQPDGKLLIGGSIFINFQKYYYCTVRLNSTLGLEVPENNMHLEDIYVYPNPFSDLLTVRFSSNINADIKFRMYDSMGREIDFVMQRSVENSGINQNELSILPSLSSGLYFLTTSINNKTKSIKLYKM